MRAIFRREFKSLFLSPIGYVFLCIILLTAGICTYTTFGWQSSSVFTMTYQYIFIFSMLLIPVLTMRSLSEDKKLKTDQALLTAPVSLTGLVTGKLLAAWGVYALSVSATLVHAATLSFFTASMNWTIVIGNIIASLLYALAYIAIGIFLSSLTESQVVAAFSTLGVGLFLMLIDSVTAMIQSPAVGRVVAWISFQSRYYEFADGRFSLSGAVFFLSVASVFVFLTVRVLEKRRWS